MPEMARVINEDLGSQLATGICGYGIEEIGQPLRPSKLPKSHPTLQHTAPAAPSLELCVKEACLLKDPGVMLSITHMPIDKAHDDK